jgi:hypothetical protein
MDHDHHSEVDVPYNLTRVLRPFPLRQEERSARAPSQMVVCVSISVPSQLMAR